MRYGRFLASDNRLAANLLRLLRFRALGWTPFHMLLPRCFECCRQIVQFDQLCLKCISACLLNRELLAEFRNTSRVRALALPQIGA